MNIKDKVGWPWNDTPEEAMQAWVDCTTVFRSAGWFLLLNTVVMVYVILRSMLPKCST